MGGGIITGEGIMWSVFFCARGTGLNSGKGNGARQWIRSEPFKLINSYSLCVSVAVGVRIQPCGVCPNFLRLLRVRWAKIGLAGSYSLHSCKWI